MIKELNSQLASVLLSNLRELTPVGAGFLHNSSQRITIIWSNNHCVIMSPNTWADKALESTGMDAVDALRSFFLLTAATVSPAQGYEITTTDRLRRLQSASQPPFAHAFLFTAHAQTQPRPPRLKTMASSTPLPPGKSHTATSPNSTLHRFCPRYSGSSSYHVGALHSRLLPRVLAKNTNGPACHLHS